MTRSLRLLVVMDPIERVVPAKDSTFAMLLEAKRRGWEVHYAELDAIWIRDGDAYGRITELEVTGDASTWFQRGRTVKQPLGTMDVILMRKDPPFDMEYIFATYILERAEDAGALVVNRPASLRDANEKAFVSWFPECAAPTLISRSLAQLRAFVEEHDRAVIKPLDRMAGRSVFVTSIADVNRNVLLETMTDFGNNYVMAQRYIPDITTSGDTRILLIDGEPFPHGLVRFPPADDHRGNISVGATTKCRPLTAGEERICERVGPALRERGLLFVGIDVIGDFLTEINVTSPTGIRELDRACGSRIAGDLMDAVQDRIQDGSGSSPRRDRAD